MSEREFIPVPDQPTDQLPEIDGGNSPVAVLSAMVHDSVPQPKPEAALTVGSYLRDALGLEWKRRTGEPRPALRPAAPAQVEPASWQPAGGEERLSRHALRRQTPQQARRQRLSITRAENAANQQKMAVFLGGTISATVGAVIGFIDYANPSGGFAEATAYPGAAALSLRLLIGYHHHRQRRREAQFRELGDALKKAKFLDH